MGDEWKFVKLVDLFEHGGQGVVRCTAEGLTWCTACAETVPVERLLDHVIGPSRWWLSRHRRAAWRFPKCDDGPRPRIYGEVGPRSDDAPFPDQLERLRDEKVVNGLDPSKPSPFRVLETRDRVYCAVCDVILPFNPDTRRADARKHLDLFRHKEFESRIVKPAPGNVPRCRPELFGVAPVMNLTRNLRRRLRGRAASSLTFEEAVGCAPEELAARLESGFKPGMTWENYGSHHVDHVAPVSAFDMSDTYEAMLASHWSNLQCLWGHENLRKGCSLPPP